jgi:disulfide bond formation protein DsbB
VTRTDALGDRALLGAGAVVALVATSGSLYLSEVMGLYPCDLCWYQRILMYPLVVVLGIAAVERRATIYRTVLPLSVGGVVVSGYHSWLQATSDGSCSFGGGCAAIQFRLQPLGLTVPNLALTAFVLVTAVAVTCWSRAR